MANTQGIRFAEGIQPYTVYGPIDMAGLTTNTRHVNVSGANWLSFLINIGVTSSASSADLEVGVACSTAETSAAAVPTLIPFVYRISSTLGTSEYAWSALTTGSSVGSVAVTTGQDSISVFIDVDPADIASVGEDYKWAHLLLTSSAAAIPLSVVAFLEPRYPGLNIPHTT
jgi:hypothetical protein